MNKGLRIVLNMTILLIVAGFVWYMVSTIKIDETSFAEPESSEKEAFASPYAKVDFFNIPGTISCFELSGNKLYVATEDSVLILDTIGKRVGSFGINSSVRDIVVKNGSIYLLFPTDIAVFSMEGQQTGAWEACSDNSDYCSFTLASDFVFVTDAENKNICKYRIDGNFVKFINSPRGFILPSYSFDIETINDTIYCVNSGRHQVESYTLDGDFIASFGQPGGKPGAFVGCCNPAYISFSPEGDIITSEKGNPRISLYQKNGKFKKILLNSKLLGGGSKAYGIRMQDDKIYVAGNKEISVFVADSDGTVL